jgi:hypothetical protein
MIDHQNSRLWTSCQADLAASEIRGIGKQAHSLGLLTLISVRPGRWSGQSEKELVLAEPFLHPETERQATEVGRFCSGCC